MWIFFQEDNRFAYEEKYQIFLGQGEHADYLHEGLAGIFCNEEQEQEHSVTFLFLIAPHFQTLKKPAQSCQRMF